MRYASRAIVLAALAAVACAAAASAAPPPVTTPAGAIKQILAERRANGLPGTIKENKKWSADCALHDHYMTVNNVLAHPEDPSKPAYTTLGNWAGTNAVLAENATWLPNANPFATAPIHLIQLLSPSLTTIGVSIGAHFLCATTWPGFDDSALPRKRMYTFPGDGNRNVPASETASELPHVPQQFVGIPAGKTTGPHLFAWATGFGASGYSAHVTAASLIGPTGRPVAIRTVDRTTNTVGESLPPASAMIIPVSPLLAGANYRASITITSTAGSTSYTWTFQTAGTWTGKASPVVALHPLHSPKVMLADTTSTLTDDVLPVPVATSPGSNPAHPTITAPAKTAATAPFQFQFTIPNRNTGCDLLLFGAGGKLGELDGFRYGSSVDLSKLFPLYAHPTQRVSFQSNWLLSTSGPNASVSFNLSTGIIGPGSYRLEVRAGGHTATTRFTITD